MPRVANAAPEGDSDGSTMKRPAAHALRVVGLGLGLGVLLYVGYLALGMLP